MEAWLGTGVFALFFALVAILLGRYQTSRYQRDLGQHSATTEQMLEEQRRTQEVLTRQTLALERIATALEKRA